MPYDAELNLPIRLAEEGSVADSSEDDDDEFDSESHTTEGETTVITESFVATVRDTLYIESELQPDAASVPSHDSDGHSRAAKFGRPTPKPRVSNGAASSATAQDSASSASPAARAVDARVAAGDAWATRYQEDRKSQQLQRPVQASRSRLRAYHIWHANDALRPEDIARLLREPPLLTSTVANYILEAILFEKLPFERDRLREQVLSHVPEKVVMSKYRTLAEECRAADASTSTETAPCEETASSG